MQRALLIACLSKGASTLHGVGWTDDSRHMADIIRRLGATINEDSDRIYIIPASGVRAESINLHVGESGLGLRMLATASTLFADHVKITGQGTLLDRPVEPIIDVLHPSGLDLQKGTGNTLLEISGQLNGGSIKLDASFSSQLISGILISLPLINESTVLSLENAVSLPYIDMTVDIIRAFGGEIKRDGQFDFIIPGGQNYNGNEEYFIEGDWSGAANHLVGGAISGSCTVTGLNPKSAQADKAILKILMNYGAETDLSDDGKLTMRKKESKPFTCDIKDCPDLFPCLVILAASCHGTSVIHGVKRLLHKESNRLEAMNTEFSKLGLVMTHEDNTAVIKGKGHLLEGRIDSRGDHRIAMAGALASTIAKGAIVITNPDCVAKSYPDFFKDIESCTRAR